TIRAATIADHCIATGWSNSLATDNGGAGANQAVFPANGTGVGFQTNYWLLDGNGSYTGFGCGTGGPGCGIKIDGSSCTQSECDDISLAGGLATSPTNITVQYVEILGAGYANADSHVDNNFHD